MKIDRLRVNPRFLMITLILVYSIAPVVSRFISDYLTTYAYMLIVVMAFLNIMFRRKISSINHYITVLAPFLLYQLLTIFTNTKSIVIWGYGVLYFLLPIMVGYYVLYERRDYLPGLVRILWITLITTAITTIIGLGNYPRAARILATTESADDPMYVTYNWNNIGGFEFVYSLVLLYPLVIMAYKEKKLSKWVMAVLAIVIGTVVVMSEYTTALLLFLVSSCLLFVKKELTPKHLVIISVCGILITTAFSGVVSDVLRWFADVLDSEVLKARLTALAGGSTGLEKLEGSRIVLYRRSLRTFFANPILGTMLSGGKGIGGHSQIFDALAQYGLVGIALMIWMYKSVYTLFLKPYQNEKNFGYVIWFFVQTLLLSTINTGLWMTVLALYGPILLFTIYNASENTGNGELGMAGSQ